MATNKDKLIASAQKLVEKGSLDKAIKEYLKVVEADEKDVRIWLKIGDLYSKIGKKQEATETYERVANFYSEQGFYLKAVAVYKQILKIDPRLVEVNQKLAELYKQLGLLSDAMHQFEALASFYSKEGKTRDAIGALKQIVELDPETVPSRIKLAEMYTKEGMAREAIEEFTRAANQLREAGRLDEFMKVAERLLFHEPGNLKVTKELANLYIEKGDPRRALPKLQVGFKADSRDTEVLRMLARAFEALDQLPKAVSVLKELARIHNENRDNKARDDVYRRILKLAPDDTEAKGAVGRGGTKLEKVQRLVSQRGATEDEGGFVDEMSNNNTEELDVDDLDAIEDAQDDFDPAPRTVATSGQPSKGPVLRSFAEGEEEGTGSRISDEEAIVKILNETDVYIKYHLHGKAIEHIQRVFDRNPTHIEAREKLKAIYLIIDKRADALRELWLLAEHVPVGNARRYLREILELDPSNARAAGLLGERISDHLATVQNADSATEQTAERTLERSTGRRAATVEGFDVDDTRPRSMREAIAEIENGDVQEITDDDYDLSAATADSSAAKDELVPLVVVEEPEPAPTPAEKRRSRKRTAEREAAKAALAKGEQVPLAEEADRPLTSPGPSTFQPEETHEGSVSYESAPIARPDASLEDDLDEADFFIHQRLFQEARAILDGLLVRYPNNPLVSSKQKELDAAQEAPIPGLDAAVLEVEPIEYDPDLAEISEEIPVPSEVVTDPGSGLEEVNVSARKGVIERGVTAEDFETHYDLGIAYKEMGLVDDAISEFRIVMKDPAREVQCHLMIGLCFMEQGLQTDAINQYKKGLYVDGITDRETLSLYFELGLAYEKLGDMREGLYYFEKVMKRDARFRDVERHVEGLRADSPAEEVPPASSDDVDAAFETIVGKESA